MGKIESLSGALARRDPSAPARRELPQWAGAIRREYGSAREMVAQFGVRQQAVMAMHWQKAMMQMPSAVRVARTYGAEVFAGLVGVHITAALKSMGGSRDVDPDEVALTAQALLSNENVMRLNMASLLAFFGKLRSGEIELSGWLTTGKIAQALNAYAKVQIGREIRVRVEAERTETRLLLADQRDNAIKWDDYCALKGLDPEELGKMDAATRCRAIAEASQGKESREKSDNDKTGTL